MLHFGVILFSVLIIYYLTNRLQNQIKESSPLIKSIYLITILSICVLGPQILYQIRPYTFYISGFAIGGILLLFFATQSISGNETITFPWGFGIFLISFIVGYFIPWSAIQYLIFSLTVLVIILTLSSSEFKILWKSILICSILVISITFWWLAKPISFHEEQANYEDKVVFTSETQFHDVVITQWHEDFWIFVDKLKNVSSIDDYLFYEPMAHSVFKIEDGLNEVLIIGGENGCLIREVLKHKEVDHVDVISYDTLLRKLGQNEKYFTMMNKDAYQDKKVKILHEDLIEYVSDSDKKYDAIFIDLPDPRSIETNQYYTFEFYQQISEILYPDGLMITQAGSPYFATQAYFCIGQTIEESGFSTLPIHNQILTLGEWGWYICSQNLQAEVMKKRLIKDKLPEIETSWFNQEAAKLVASFGKSFSDTLNPGINTLDNPLVYQYYLKGNWDLN